MKRHPGESGRDGFPRRRTKLRADVQGRRMGCGWVVGMFVLVNFNHSSVAGVGGDSIGYG